MSKSHRQKKASAPPSLENPGREKELPPEVNNPERKSPLERERDMHDSEILRILRQEVGSSGFITLRRRHPSGGFLEFGYLGQMPIDQFSIENVSNLYGGGDFKGKARAEGGTFSREVCFTIDHSIPPKNPKGGGQKEQTPPPADNTPALIAAIKDAIKPPPQDNSMVQGLFTVLAAAIARPEPKQDNRVIELILANQQKSDERFEKLLEELAKKDRRTEPLKELVETVRMIDELRGDAPKDEKLSFAEMLGRGLGAGAGPMLQRMFGGDPGGGPTPLAITAGAGGGQATPDPANPAGQQTNKTVNPFVASALSRFRSAAVAAAQKKKEAFDWVDSLFDTIPETYHAHVYKAAAAPTWFADVFGHDPEAANHVAWLQEMRACILSRMFVIFSEQCAASKTPPITPAQCAERFLAQIDPKYEDDLWNEIEPNNWAQLFEGRTIDPVWLEELRLVLDKQLNPDGGQEEAPPPPPPVAHPAPAKRAAGGKK